jgi:hypothetical protein
MKSLFLSLSILSLLTIAACNRDDTPAPVEQELITTIRLIVKDSAGTARTFDYRVQNGFGSTSPGSIRVDSVVLPASPAHFNVEVRVLNESAQPAEDITDEIIAERDDHLFIVHATAEAGSSPIAFGSGSTDNAGRPFNQTLKLNAPSASSGQIIVTLRHEPTDKNSSVSPGGETDAEAVFPYRITP